MLIQHRNTGSSDADSTGRLHSDRVTRVLVFFGFVGLIGWLGSSWFIFHLSKWSASWSRFGLDSLDGLGLWQSLHLFAQALGQCSFFLLLSLPVIAGGLPRLRTCRQRRPLVAAPLVAAIFLSPLYVGLGILLVLLVPVRIEMQPPPQTAQRNDPPAVVVRHLAKSTAAKPVILQASSPDHFSIRRSEATIALD